MHPEKITRFLCTLPLFKGTDPAQLSDIIQSDKARICRAAPGERIGHADQRALGILLSGRATIRSADDEKNVILRSVGAGEIFGAAALFLESAPPLSHIFAEQPCDTLFLDVSLVRELMTRSPAFLDAYLAFLASRVQFLNNRIRCFTAGSAERKLALFLTDRARDGDTVTVSLTALSDALAIGRASLYRALDKLEGEGLLRHDGRHITLISKEKLLKKYQ